jgi:hypothetical protein
MSGVKRLWDLGDVLRQRVGCCALTRPAKPSHMKLRKIVLAGAISFTSGA